MTNVVILFDSIKCADHYAKGFAERFKGNIKLFNKTKREFILKDKSTIIFDSDRHWNHGGGCVGRHNFIAVSENAYKKIITKMSTKEAEK